MKRYIFIVLSAYVSVALISCHKTIVKEDVYGIWSLQNEVDFKGEAWGLMEIINDSNIWIDPCINDTMYHYQRMNIKGDSLILTDYLSQQFIYTIQELHDSTLIIADFPDVSSKLRFKKIYSYAPAKEGEVQLPIFIAYSAEELSPDSLDVIIKTADILHAEYEYDHTKPPYILSHAEMIKARDLLNSYITNKEYLNDGNCWDENRYPFPFNKYVRQYIAYQQDGHIIVYVNLMTNWLSVPPCLYYTSLKKDMHCVHDGGPRYAQATIDLTEGKVIFFMTNGY